jgi:hypothetical protein
MVKLPARSKSTSRVLSPHYLSETGRDNASNALWRRSANKLSSYLPALAPNHFVCSLFARQAQDELVGHFKIVRGADAHPAVGAVDSEAIVRWCARFGHDDREVPEWPA